MLKKFAITVFFLIAFNLPLFSADNTWTANAGGDWGLGGNWSEGNPPTNADIALFPKYPEATVLIDIFGGTNQAESLSFNAVPQNDMSAYTIQDSVGGGIINLGATGVLATDQPDLNSYTTIILANIGIANSLTPFGNDTNNVLRIQGVISGAGSPNIAGNVFFDNINTFTGGLQLSSGSLSIGLDGALGDADNSINFAGDSTLDVGGFMTIDRQIVVEDGVLGSLIYVNDLGPLTLDGVISGDGTFSIGGSRSVVLNATNTIRGGLQLGGQTGIVVSSNNNLGDPAGILDIVGGASLELTDSFTNTHPIVLQNFSRLTFSAAEGITSTLTGQISGVGSLVFSGGGRFTLTAANTYSAGTVIDAGVVSISQNSNLGVFSDGLSDVFFDGENPTLEITNSFEFTQPIGINTGTTATIDTLEGVEVTMNGVISASGALNKAGLGELILLGANACSEGTTVSAGTLSVRGSLDPNASVTVGAAGTLKGAGSMGTVVNTSGGVVAPGNSIGTMTITGNYTQGPTSTLEIEINPSGASDVLDVSGTANLDGTLLLLPEPGVYTATTTYRFITAATVNRTFSSFIETHPASFRLIYGSSFVDLEVLASFAVLPTSIDSLRGNSRRVADYLFSNGFIATNTDLLNALNTLAALPLGFYETALIKVSPLIYGALPIVNLQNDIRMSHTMTKCYRKIENQRIIKERKKRFFHKRDHKRVKVKRENYGAYNPSSFWIEPTFFVYNQESFNGRLTDEGQPAFDAYTYGTSLGGSHFFDENLTASVGLGYTHSSIAWTRGMGSGYWNTGYISPSVSWINDRVCAYGLLLASFNFYKMNRNIHYWDIDRTASNRHNSYDFLVQGGGHYRFQMPKSNFSVQPEVEFNYLMIFQEGYKEGGASALNLKVRRKTAMYFQPNINLRFIQEFYTKIVVFTPSVYLGWLINTPVTNGKLISRLIVQDTSRENFAVLTYPKATNQITLGCDLPIQNYQGFAFKIGYEVNLLSQYQIYQLTAKLDWDF